LDYRVIYEIHDGELLVLVLRKAHRRQVYER
jgi:mRNA interferase RelE/StbE